MKSIKKGAQLFLTFLLLFSIIGVESVAFTTAADTTALTQALQATMPDTQEGTQLTMPPDPEKSLADSPSEALAEMNSALLEEDVAKRSAYEKHFRGENGRYTAFSYDEPIHKEVNGKWVEVDNTLKTVRDETGAEWLETRDGLFTASFAKNPGEKLVRMEQDGKALSWTLQARELSVPQQDTEAALPEMLSPLPEETPTEDASAIDFVPSPVEKSLPMAPELTARVMESDVSKLSANEKKSMALKSASTLRYDDSFEGKADVEYIVTPRKLKENIILESPQTITSYVAQLQTEGLNARLLENREIEFYDEERTVFTMQAPYMFDSAGAESDAIAVTLEPQEDGGYRLTLTPDTAWLNSEARVYPVTVDPTVEANNAASNLEHNYIVEDAGVQTVTDRLYFGMRNSKINRTYLKFKTLPTIPSTAVVLYAYQVVLLMSGTTTAKNINAYRVKVDWTAANLKWATRPGSTAVSTDIPAWGTNGYLIDVTLAAKHWYQGKTNGSNQNYGVIIRHTAESGSTYNAIYSKSAAADKRPAFAMEYLEGATQANLTNNGVYFLKSKHSTRPYMDVAGGSSSSDTNVHGFTFNGTPAQQWKAIKIAEGVYEFAPMTNTNLRLDVVDSGFASEANVRIFTANSSYAQRWQVIKRTDGSYSFIPCLYPEYYLGKSAANNNVLTWARGGGQEQRWLVESKHTYTNSGHENAGYNRANVKTYAENYATYASGQFLDTPNYVSTKHSKAGYLGDGDGNNCTNFVSQCLKAGGMADKGGSSTRTESTAWFYDTYLTLYYASYTWGGAPNFAQHWGHNDKGVGNQRAYMTVFYPSAQHALNDWNYIESTFSAGDVIQIANDTGIYHTLIIHNTANMYYAQHTGNKKEQSLRTLLENSNGKFIFHKIS